MRKFGFIVLLVVFSLLLSSCVTLAEKLGFVPVEQYNLVVADRDQFQTDLSTQTDLATDLGGQLSSCQAVLDNANNELFNTQANLVTQTTLATDRGNELNACQTELATANTNIASLDQQLLEWESNLCDYTWHDLLGFSGFYPFEGTMNGSQFEYYVFFTQWSSSSWNDNLPSTTLLIDKDENWWGAIDTENDCLVLNPNPQNHP